MLFGILSCCDSITEICEELLAFGGKLNHLGLEKAQAKSTACDGLRNRDSKFFENLYFILVKYDQNFLKNLELVSHSMVVFDKAYNYYQQLALWTQKQVYFVTRMKKNAEFTVIEVKRTHYRKSGQSKVLRDEIIKLEYHPEDEFGERDMNKTIPLRLRKVSYQDEKNRFYEFLTNNFDIEAEEVAFLYKKRWGIELLFK